MRQLIAVTPDSADRKSVDTGSYTRWNHAYGSVHRGTGQQYRFQSRGNHGQPHQSHMMRFSGRQQFNSVNLAVCTNRIDIMFTRPEMTKITRGKDDN
ncbi:hypothetical protein TNCV_3061061 [Trichonephila clavipes]|nr:hypothetical protein TNCV_3061061 [Trichonephila clavipes]